MTDLPSPRERRTAKVVIYVTPGDKAALQSLAKWVDMSLSEMCAETLLDLADQYQETEGGGSAQPVSPKER